MLREEPAAFHCVDTTCNAMDITYYQKEPSIYLFNKDDLRIMLAYVSTRYLIARYNNRDWRTVRQSPGPS